MIIRSLLQSSRLEILTSKRLTFSLYAIFGSSIMIWWGVASYQFVHAYYALNEFDIDVATFLWVTLVSFMALVAVGAYMLSLVMLRIRQNLWYRKTLIYSQYEPALNPAAAGLLEDFEFSSEETWATLLHLRNKGIIEMHVMEGELQIKLKTFEGDDLREYEKKLLEGLMVSHSKFVPLGSIYSTRLIEAGKKAHQVLLTAIKHQGFKDTSIRLNKSWTWMVRIIFFIAGFIGLMLIYQTIFHYDIVSNILYPRFPVQPIELMADGAVWLVAITIILSGFWPRFDKENIGKLDNLILESRGFKRYLGVVYSHKFTYNNLDLLTPSDLAAVAPYMIAYRLVPLEETYIMKLIELLDSQQGDTNPAQ